MWLSLVQLPYSPPPVSATAGNTLVSAIIDLFTALTADCGGPTTTEVLGELPHSKLVPFNIFPKLW